VARGQTFPDSRSVHYARAITLLADYQDQLGRLLGRGHLTGEQHALLSGYADILRQELSTRDDA
jgi:hypothetical protein